MRRCNRRWGSPGRAFLTELALDPVLVEEFLDDPDGVMDAHQIPGSVRPVLRCGEDVPILRALLDGAHADADAHEDGAAVGQAASGWRAAPARLSARVPYSARLAWKPMPPLTCAAGSARPAWKPMAPLTWSVEDIPIPFARYPTGRPD